MCRLLSPQVTRKAGRTSLCPGTPTTWWAPTVSPCSLTTLRGGAGAGRWDVTEHGATVDQMKKRTHTPAVFRHDLQRNSRELGPDFLQSFPFHTCGTRQQEILHSGAVHYTNRIQARGEGGGGVQQQAEAGSHMLVPPRRSHAFVYRTSTQASARITTHSHHILVSVFYVFLYF